jgi:hypothetical protein
VYGAGPPRHVGIEAEPLELRDPLRELGLELLRAGTDPRELDRAALRAAPRNVLDVAAVMAVEPLVGVERERDVAVRASARDAAGATPRRLSRRIAVPPCSSIAPSAASNGAESG